MRSLIAFDDGWDAEWLPLLSQHQISNLLARYPSTKRTGTFDGDCNRPTGVPIDAKRHGVVRVPFVRCLGEGKQIDRYAEHDLLRDWK